jgi:hypothetical protein
VVERKLHGETLVCFFRPRCMVYRMYYFFRLPSNDMYDQPREFRPRSKINRQPVRAFRQIDVGTRGNTTGCFRRNDDTGIIAPSAVLQLN